MREERDRALCTPRLLIPSIQVNMRAGRFPPADEHGVRYLRVPVTLKDGDQSPRHQLAAVGLSRIARIQSATKMTSVTANG